MPRFVVLTHVLPEGHPRPTHWDLMLEFEGSLATWALSEPPAIGKGISAERLADHRLAYLDYEGPVSRDRGAVTRWDAGDYRPIAIEQNRWEVFLEGQELRGRLTLEQVGADAGWLVQLAAASSP